jgi:putative ABC transport system permease protein
VHRADEVAINEASVDQAHVDVGDVLRVVTLSPTQRLRISAGDQHAFDHGPLGPDLRLKVVGVFRGAADVVGRSSPTIFATPAFDHAYRGRIAYSSRVILVRRASGISSEAFHAAVSRVTSQNPLGVFDAATEDKPARQTTHTLAVGLVVFALVAALASLLVVGQAVARHASGAEPDQFSLAAIGFTRAQRIRGIVGTVVPVALLGGLFAGLASYAASTLMPVGLARRIEPHPGVRFDALVTGAAALAVIAVVAGAGLLAALPITRSRRAQHRARRASQLASSLGSAGAGPVLTTGARLAFDRRPPALPVKSALLGVGGAIAVVVAAVTFSASLERLANDHQRWGYGWDLMLDTTPDGVVHLTRELAANHDLESVSLLAATFTLTDHSRGIRAYGLERIHGAIGYALRSGVQPVGPDEVVVGPDTARKLHLRIGRVMNVAVCPCTGVPATTRMGRVRIVGTALFPEDDDGNFTDALGFSGTGFKHHAGEFPNDTRAAVSIAAGRDLSAVARTLGRRYPGQVSQYSYPSRPGEVENLRGLQRFPRILAGFTALLGIAALQNVLVTTLRRRRRELATLRTLGLTPRQTSRCITWQSLSLTTVALAVGVPVGIVAGARTWAAATQSIGVATDPNRPVLTIVVFSLVTLAFAIAISIPVGWRASRIHPAAVLHAE